MNIISIIIPCYNAEKYVAEAIESVKNQTENRWECIIVDDGSTDKSLDIITEEIKDDSRFKIIVQKNLGVAVARNKAIENANGKYILPLDADDRLRPQAVERLMEFWEKYPNSTLLVPQRQKFDENGLGIIQDRKWKGYAHLMKQCSPSNSSCYKKSDWERVGGYRSGLMYEDWEFWIRLLYKNANVINIEEVLADYRIHSDSRMNEANRRRRKEIMSIRRMNYKIFKNYGG